METPKPNPRVGVAALIQRPDGRVVFGRRKGSHGADQWAFPGGHLEHGEEITTCAERETLEETGLDVRALRIVAVTNSVFAENGSHYVTLFALCEMQNVQQEPQLLEPNKCHGWEWASWEEIKQKDAKELFLPVHHLLQQSLDFEKSLS